MQKISRLYFLFLVSAFCSLLPGLGFADSASPAEKGNASYQSGDYQGAVKAYHEALHQGAENGDLHYNLGNAFYRLHDFGHAIAEYRKALLALPADADVSANLALARKQAKDRIEGAGNLMDSALLRFAPPLSMRNYERLFLGAYVLAWCALSLSILLRNPVAKTAGVALLIIAAPLGALTFGARPGYDGRLEFALTPEARSLQPGVIVASEAKVYSGDGEKYQVIFLLHSGAELMTGDSRGDWVEAILPDSRRGWVRRGDVEIIE